MHKMAQKESIDTEKLVRQLTPTIQYLSKQYTSGLTPAPQIPSHMRRTFYAQLDGFNRTMAMALSTKVVNIFETADDFDSAVSTVGTEFRGQMKRLSNILRQDDQNFQNYLALAELSDYPHYVFLSEKSPTTCERCMDKHGGIFTLEDVSEQGGLPPLHFHCRCRLVAMDSQMASIYQRSSAGVLALLDEKLDEGYGEAGGLFHLTHDAWFRGISSETIRRIDPAPWPGLRDSEHMDSAWYEGLAQWALKFGADAINYVDAFMQRARSLPVKADEALKENPPLGLLLWVDYFLGGIPSALLEGIVHRWDMMTENTNLNSVLNFLTLGFGELIDGVVAPEEPWSFQHFMDMLGLLTLIYGAVKGIKGAPGADDAIGVMDDAASAVDDIVGTVDDAAGLADDVVGIGSLTGRLDGLTQAERTVVNDLLHQGKNIEIIPKDPASILKTPDFKIDGILTELKTILNPNTNTVITRIQNGFKQNAQSVLIDARSAGLTMQQAQEAITRVIGTYSDGIPGEIEIWYSGGIITYP